MAVTLEQIETAVGQIKDNMATKREVIELIDQKVNEDKEQAAAVKKGLDETNQTVEEQKSFIDNLTNQIKLLQRTRFSSLKTPEGSYNGCWGNLEQAKNFGLFILASIAGNKKAQKQLEDIGIEVKHVTEKAMGEDVQSTGGALVPTEFIPNIIVLQEKYGVFRRNVQEYPMGSDSAVAPNLSSGLTVYCPGAGTAITKSDLALSTVGLTAKKWATLTAIDSELDEDAAIAIGELIGRQIAQAFAKKEDEVGFLGDGTSTYFGHTGIAGALRDVDATIGNIKSLVVGTGNVYSELTLADFESVEGIVPDYADDLDLKWYCSRKFYFTVMVKLALAVGGVNATEVQLNRMARQKFFLGYPVELAQAMPNTEANSQICALLANLRMGAYLGDRRRLTIAKSSEVYFAEDQLGIRGTERVAPTVHGVGDTTNAGPICGLITAAS